MAGNNKPIDRRLAWERALRDDETEASPRERSFLLVLMMLRTFADSEATCFPSQKTLARAARMSIKSVRRHLKAAETRGWIATGLFKRQGQAWRGMAYRLTVPTNVHLNGFADGHGDTIVSHRSLEGGDKLVSQGRDNPRSRWGQIEAKVGTALCPNKVSNVINVLKDATALKKARGQAKAPDPPEARKQRIRELRRAFPDESSEVIRKLVTNATAAEVELVMAEEESASATA